MKRHKQGCDVWEARDIAEHKAGIQAKKKATALARYGVEDATQAPEVVARRKATNVARYGAANPFSKESSTFQKVQDSLDGKRPVLKGADNPFAKPEVKAKVRAAMVEKYGEENPQRVKEIRARTRETMNARYGGELMGSPVIRAKADATNLVRYGTTEPSRTPEVTERIRQTNLVRHGVEWTNQDPDVRGRQLDTMFAHYDGKHYFASEEGKREVRAALKERYGVETPGAIEGHWIKALATFRKNHSGFLFPMQLGGTDDGPNGFEQQLWDLCPKLIYTGDKSFWRYLPLLGRCKNPDFLVPGPDPQHPYRGLTKVVEGFGDFHHGKTRTGKEPAEHEKELKDSYHGIGIECLVIWQSQLIKDPVGVRERLLRFVGDTPTPVVDVVEEGARICLHLAEAMKASLDSGE